MKNHIVDVPKWNEACWRGVLYIVDLSLRRPPILGLIFRNEAAAVDIFTGWRSLVGLEDENNRIRISIVEGDIQGQDSGYTVHITTNPDAAFETANQKFDPADQNTLMLASRVFRMNPDPGSRNLPNFKSAYSQIGKFLMIPVAASSQIITATSIKPLLELGVSKSKIIFQNAMDIKKGDIDSVVFTKGL